MMTRQKGDKLVLKDISVYDQSTMGLEWAWKAGAIVTYVDTYGSDYYKGTKYPCSLINMYVEKEKRPRELWVFDMFIKSRCVWNV